MQSTMEVDHGFIELRANFIIMLVPWFPIFKDHLDLHNSIFMTHKNHWNIACLPIANLIHKLWESYKTFFIENILQFNSSSSLMKNGRILPMISKLHCDLIKHVIREDIIFLRLA